MLTKADLEALAETRLQDAVFLLNAGAFIFGMLSCGLRS